MHTIITVTTTEHGSMIHKRLRDAFPEASIIVASQVLNPPDTSELSGIVIVEELNKCSHPSFYVNKILNIK
jgi:hypothetical protein